MSVITFLKSADYFDNVMTKFMIKTGQTHEKPTEKKGRGVKIKSKDEKKARQKCEKLQSDASNIASLSHKLLFINYKITLICDI